MKNPVPLDLTLGKMDLITYYTYTPMNKHTVKQRYGASYAPRTLGERDRLQGEIGAVESINNGEGMLTMMTPTRQRITMVMIMVVMTMMVTTTVAATLTAKATRVNRAI